MPAKFLSLKEILKITQSVRLVFVIMLLSLWNARAQDCSIVYEGEQKAKEIFNSRIGGELKLCDSLVLLQRLNNEILQLQQEGYLLAAHSSLLRKDSTWYTNCFLGKRFKWSKLNINHLPNEILLRAGYQKRHFENEVFSIAKMKLFFQRLIRESDNMGLPFASLSLDSVTIDGDKIGAKLIYYTGPVITFDSLRIIGEARIKNSWLTAYLGINHGQNFSQRTVNQITGKIKNLRFTELRDPPTISFQNKKALITLDLAPKKVRTIELIIGFLTKEEESGKLIVTGQFDLALINLFNSGKSLDIQWQSLKARSQLLDVKYNHPNLFHSPLDIDVAFNLLKEDTIFITRQARVRFVYLRSFHSFSIFSEFQSSNLLSTDGLEDLSELPELLDLNVDYYGLEYGLVKLNDVYVPTSGHSLWTTAAVGSKRIRRNDDFPPELFEEVDISTTQYKLTFEAKNYLELSKDLVLYAGMRAGKIFNDQLYLNDLFRIGGLNSLRGFNENFFFSSDYALSNLEIQLHFEENSYLLAFYDQAYLYYRIPGSRFEDYPLGIGLGLNLSTKNGSVRLAYALGRSGDQPLSLSLSKFHFGYVTRF